MPAPGAGICLGFLVLGFPGPCGGVQRGDGVCFDSHRRAPDGGCWATKLAEDATPVACEAWKIEVPRAECKHKMENGFYGDFF